MDVNETDIATFLEDHLSGTFIKFSNGEAIWQFNTMKSATNAINALAGAGRPHNWCPVQQPKGPAGRKPTICVTL
jgi:hypothetical protein